jgi:uncharacterized protein (DUF2141 family)
MYLKQIINYKQIIMLRIIITLLISILSFLVKAQETNQELTNQKKGVDIVVSISKIRNNNGKVYFALFNSKENFYERISFQKQEGTIKENQTQITFKDVPEGEYAITCYHDANDNHKLDFEGYMPTEDYGSSNNPQSFGPPQFEVSKFKVDSENLKFEIKF